MVYSGRYTVNALSEFSSQSGAFEGTVYMYVCVLIHFRRSPVIGTHVGNK